MARALGRRNERRRTRAEYDALLAQLYEQTKGRPESRAVDCSVCGHLMLPCSLGRHVACDPCSPDSDTSPQPSP